MESGKIICKRYLRRRKLYIQHFYLQKLEEYQSYHLKFCIFAIISQMWTVVLTTPATIPCVDSRLHFLKLRNPTRYRDPTRMVEAVYPLRLLQQLSKQGVIKVNNRHKHPPGFVIRLPHVHSQVSLGYLRGFCLTQLDKTRFRTRKTKLFSSTPYAACHG